MDENWSSEMEMKLNCAEEKTNLVIGFTQGLLRNTEFRKNVIGSGGYTDSNGRWIPDQNSRSEEIKVD